MADKILVGNVKMIDTQYGQITKLGFKAEDLKVLETKLKNGWVNLDVKQGKSGKWYMEVSQFEAKPKAGGTDFIESPVKPTKTDDLPF